MSTAPHAFDLTNHMTFTDHVMENGGGKMATV